MNETQNLADILQKVREKAAETEKQLAIEKERVRVLEQRETQLTTDYNACKNDIEWLMGNIMKSCRVCKNRGNECMKNGFFCRPEYDIESLR